MPDHYLIPDPGDRPVVLTARGRAALAAAQQLRQLRQLDVDLAVRLAPDHADHRDPYVGDGADGARRSAQIDREEVDCLDHGTPRYDMLLASAAAWDRQADELDADR